MITITTALQAEAAPCIDFFELKPVFNRRKMRFYRNEQLWLVIGGIGKVSASIAATMIHEMIKVPPMLCLNIGICGSSGNHPIGNLYQINSIRDADTGFSYYPDLIIASNWETEGLETHAEAVTKSAGKKINAPLVDMEASGFFQAASFYTDPSSIQVLKVVSDHLEGEYCKAADVSAYIDAHLEEIDNYIKKVRSKASSLISMELQYADWLNSVSALYNLTVTQKRELVQLLKYYLLKGHSKPPELNGNSAKNKTERTQYFNELKERLQS